jgi:hypothetical protein
MIGLGAWRIKWRVPHPCGLCKGGSFFAFRGVARSSQRLFTAEPEACAVLPFVRSSSAASSPSPSHTSSSTRWQAQIGNLATEAPTKSVFSVTHRIMLTETCLLR